MRSRNLKHKITFEKLTNLKNEIGEIEKDYELFKMVRASVEDFGTKESFFSNKIIDVSTVKFRIRYIKNITPEMRISFDDNFYDITAIVNPFFKNKELIIAGKVV